MKTWIKYLTLPILLLCLWGYLHWYINPVQRFDITHTPLVKPDITKKGNVADEVALEEVAPEEVAAEIKPFNVLILGIDARKQEVSRTDVIMLVNVNLKNKAVHVISIPRDTRVELPGIGFTKINHAHLLGEITGGNEGGTIASLQAVSELLQCEIEYYVKLDFVAFSNFIDTIGGIEIELDKPVWLSSARKTLPVGKQHIDGDTALKLVRERYSLPDGDFGRQKLQFLVLETVAHELLKPKSLLKLPALVNEATKNEVDTNFNTSDIISLAWMFKKLPSGSINHLQLPGQGGYAADPLVQSVLYYWFPDLEQMQEISEQFRN